CVLPAEYCRHCRRGDVDRKPGRYGWQVWPPKGEEAARQFAKDESLKKKEGGSQLFSIETLDGEPFGTVNTRIDARRFSFDYGISLGREHWGHGYGDEAVILVGRYMFGELRLHKMHAYVYAFNQRSLAMHRKLGFVEEGTLREGQFTDGRFWDIHIFGMTSEEYF